MSSEIHSALKSFKRQGEEILRRLEVARQNLKTPITDIGQDLISKGAGMVVRDLFESTFLGRTTRKYTKHVLVQQQREKKRTLEETFQAEFGRWFTSLRDFIGTISIKTMKISQPNSDKLITKLNRVLRYVKVETKINHTLTFIDQLLNQRLIYNNKIPSMPLKKAELLEPSTPFSSKQKVREILAEAKGYVKVIDPWVDYSTLEILIVAANNIPIMLLTTNVGGDKRAKSFIRLCKEFKIERPLFQVRKCKKGLLHDRYIITENKAYSTGQSLKDVGKKLSSIIEITETKAEIERHFDQIWATSTVLIL